MTTRVVATVSQFEIKAVGQRIPPSLASSVTEVLVENDLHLPDLATISIALGGFGGNLNDIPDNTLKDYLAQGKEIEISAKVEGRSQGGLIFSGEVTAVSVEFSYFDPNGPMLAVVQASDKSHRLHRGRNTKSYLNIKYSDIANKIAQAHGLTPKVDATSGVMEFVLQSNQTDWEFLMSLANRISYDLYVSGKELHFEKIQKSAGSPVELQWGSELLQFKTRATSAFQIPTVAVRGWDWKQQKPIKGEAKNGNGAAEIGESRKGIDQAKSAFGDSQVEIVNLPVVDQSEANLIAQSLADAIAMGHIYAEGSTNIGNSQILPGKMVDIKGVGKRFSGKYYVTSTTHRYSGMEGYTTSFVVGGRKPNTLFELTGGGQSFGPSPGGIQGVVVGVVTNLEDPDNLGRIKVKFPWLNDGQAEVESFWCRIASPSAGAGNGIMWLPEVNDEALVAFEHGDVNHPFVLGSLWNGRNKPPKPNNEVFKSGSVNERIIKSRSGHMIILDDTDGSEKITIRDKTEKNELVIDSSQNTLSITIEQDININAKGNIAIATAQSDVTIDCNNFTVTANQNCDLKGNSQVNIESSGQMSVKGAQTTIEGSGQAALTSSGQTQVRGSVVMIN
jgi:phage protein D